MKHNKMFHSFVRKVSLVGLIHFNIRETEYILNILTKRITESEDDLSDKTL